MERLWGMGREGEGAAFRMPIGGKPSIPTWTPRDPEVAQLLAAGVWHPDPPSGGLLARSD